MDIFPIAPLKSDAHFVVLRIQKVVSFTQAIL